MKLTFDDTITKRLLALIEDEPADFVLDFDHTLSNETLPSSCCGITRYRIVAVNKGEVPKVFDGKISSPLGDFYCKAWGMMYFDENMRVRVTANHLVK